MKPIAYCIVLSLTLSLSFVEARGDALAEATTTFALLTPGFGVEHLDALRSEAAVRGVAIEAIDAPYSEALKDSLLRDGSAEAIISFDGDNLVVVRRDGSRAHAPIGSPPPSPRAVAAIASSLLDDHASSSSAATHVSVDVDVHVGSPPVRRSREEVDAKIGVHALAPVAQRASTWFLDMGGLTIPTHDVYAVHGGMGHWMGKQTRVLALGHFASLPDEAHAGAASLQLSRVWGKTLRVEVGARALATLIRRDDRTIRAQDHGTSCALPEGCGAARDAYGVGAGGFAGLGLVTGLGTFYLRAGADLVQVEEEAPMLWPHGALGLELPL